MPKIKLVPVNTPKRRSAKPAVTLDAHDRLALNAAARDLLGVNDVKRPVYVAIDPAERVVAIRQYDERLSVSGRHYNVDKRGYIRAPWAYEMLGLRKDDCPHKFEYFGEVAAEGAEWQAFRLV